MRRTTTRAAVSLTAAVLLGAGTATEAARAQEPGLRIVVLEGEDAVNIIGQGTAVPTLIEVRDENDLPVSGAAVLFLLGDGGSATLNAGVSQVTATTNALGQAAVTVNPVATGAVEVSVRAAFEGQSATATIAQANFATAAEAAAAGSGTAGGTAGTAGAAGATGGGLGIGAMAGIAGAVAGAAVGVVVASGGDADNQRNPRPGNGDDRTPDDGEDDDDENNVPDSVPSAPDAPRLTPLDGGLRVAWDAPADHGTPIDDYDVRHRQRGTSRWTELDDTIKSTARMATIENLTNGTEYDVQVRAGNAAGDGAWSASTTGSPRREESAGVKRDRAALMELYHATNGPNWRNEADNWGTDAPLDTWRGIRTDDEGRVIHLSLRDNGLQGELPAALGNLDRLRGLFLGDNTELTGRIPPALGRLQDLEALWIALTDVRGTIPAALGRARKLQSIDLSNNQLSGAIPPSLGNLPDLNRFHLYANRLQGTIPAPLCRFANSINPQYDQKSRTVVLECADGSRSVRGPTTVAVTFAGGTVGSGETRLFEVTLSRPAPERIRVDYGTRDGTAQAGTDYVAASGTLSFAPGESTKTIAVDVLPEAGDEGDWFVLALSNPDGAELEVAEATATIERTVGLAAGLAARFGRATAEHVTGHIEERMADPRRPGLRARLGGREVTPGDGRDVARNLLSALGGNATGRFPDGARWNRSDARHTGAGQPHAPAPGTAHGSVDTVFGGRDLLGGAELELNRARGDHAVSVWSRSSQSRFGGRDGQLSLDGKVRTTMVGADYTRGRLIAGLSLARSHGEGGYGGERPVRAESSATGLYPWLGYRITERVSVWGVTGYGTGVLRLTPEQATPIETGLRTAMAAAGTRGEIVGAGATGGFELAFKADALWVNTRMDGAAGAAEQLAAADATVTRIRTGIEASRHVALGRRTALTPTVEIGVRQDGGDAETGTGIEVAGGLGLVDAGSGLSVSVRVRTLVAHQAEGFTDRGVSLSLGWNPTSSSPLGFSARVSPGWGRNDPAGLWPPGPLPTHRDAAGGGHVDAELGYGLPVGRRLVGTPAVGFATSAYGRGYRLGYSLRPLERDTTAVEIGVETHVREDPLRGGTETGFLGRASVRW